MKKRHWFRLLFLCLSVTIFSDEKEKTFSIQGNPLIYTADIVYLFSDNDIKTFIISTDVEFQYAINQYFNISVVNTIFFENYLSSVCPQSNEFSKISQP